MRAAADAGIADIAARRFRMFDSAAALEARLSALFERALADPPSNVDAGP